MADLVAVEVAERAASGCPVRLIEDDGKPILIEGDPVALRRVIANLIENAIKFGRSSVEVRIEQGPEICRVLVDDDGPGIREEDRAAIFTPFYRADASRSREHGGTGLGLAIAKQIIDAHGGMIIACRSALGGACLDIRLPLDGPR
ncbi:sensor histidine kinase [Methylobacterium sp. P31]